jgi:hypothetical protein
LGGRDGGRVVIWLVWWTTLSFAFLSGWVIWLVWWTTLSFAFVSGWALGRRRGPWAHLPP